MRREIFSEALNSIKGNILRTILTVSIIAIGITSLVGSLTAAKGLEVAIGENLGRLGAGSFLIRPAQGESPRNITYREMLSFQKQYAVEGLVAPYSKVDMGFEGVSAGGRMTNPDVEVVATFGTFVAFNGGSLALGRNFSPFDESSGADVCILGANVARTLMVGEPLSEIGVLEVLGERFRIVGVLERMGAGGGSMDNMVLIPVESARRRLPGANESFSIGVMPPGESDVDSAVEQAVEVMRGVRRIDSDGENDFQIRRRDTALGQMKDMMGMVTLAAFMIGLITLLGASVGLMNIMLVSVRERTQEIGVRKAIGATDLDIRALFLTEALLIGCAGGAVGVVFGVAAGGIVSAILEIPFGVPWGWIGVSLAVSMAVCIVSCSLPASRAAVLPPVEALRGE